MLESKMRNFFSNLLSKIANNLNKILFVFGAAVTLIALLYIRELKLFFSKNSEGVMFTINWILIISFIISGIALILLVLLQRGEEGAFSKNRGDKTTTSDKTLFRSTIICSIFFFLVALILNALIYHMKHVSAKQNNTIVVEKVENALPPSTTKPDEILPKNKNQKKTK